MQLIVISHSNSPIVLWPYLIDFTEFMRQSPQTKNTRSNR